VTPGDFTHLADLVRRRSGLVLTPDKKALAGNRLAPVARRFGFRSTAQLLAELPYPSEEVARAITEALTTNDTSFFRDAAVFHFLAKEALPALLASRGASKRLRLWCAATSTGQEAYSLATILDDMQLATKGWKIDLIATDLNEASIARAREGLYASYEIERGLPPQMLERYFVKEGKQWRVIDRLRRTVTFRAFNLLDHFGWLGEVDIILCRNVLLYIEAGLRAAIHEKLREALVADGYLILGDTESTIDHFAPAKSVRGLYVNPRGRERSLRKLAG
jgi:chemotaxis protein methyltransferase CheR